MTQVCRVRSGSLNHSNEKSPVVYRPPRLEPDATTSASAPVLAVAVDGALRVRTLAPSLLVPLENEHELLRRWLSSVLWAG